MPGERLGTERMRQIVAESTPAVRNRHCRPAPPIRRAWQKGCRFDAWHEHFRPDLWQQAFQEEGLDAQWYATRLRTSDKAFPWDHILTGVRKRWLCRDWQAVHQGETRMDCRQLWLACGILTTFAQERARAGPGTWECEGRTDPCNRGRITIRSHAQHHSRGAPHPRVATRSHAPCRAALNLAWGRRRWIRGSLLPAHPQGSSTVPAWQPH